ncbi:hypothetical protein [Pseudomonas aegrilactucae]|uniref:Uncharacterized protein n=1 Tax=Pseudomonas aegrilactucae TaxID=2854028 RepID=A0A9Q2XIZ7_9PSED|nr:hypothetical protein [Pseudomonas aegrilactucae]MBV6287067.1 hypothetical protein [Pseudomonas aegrilactucae]
MKKRSVFFIGVPGMPELVCARHQSEDVRILELFDTKSQAKAAIAETFSKPEEGTVSQAENGEIFDLIVQADVLEHGVEQIAITDLGRRYLDQAGKGEDREWLTGFAQELPETEA